MILSECIPGVCYHRLQSPGIYLLRDIMITVHLLARVNYLPDGHPVREIGVIYGILFIESVFEGYLWTKSI